MKVVNTNGLKVGDYVRGHHKGVWQITQIEPEFYTQGDVDDWNKMARYHPYRSRNSHPWKVGDVKRIKVHYTKVMGGLYDKPYRRLKKSCFIEHCKKVDAKFVSELRDEYSRRIDALSRLVLGQPLPWT